MAVFLVASADVVDDQRRIELYVLLGRRRDLSVTLFVSGNMASILSGFIACLVIASLNELFSNSFISNLKVLDSRLEYLPVDPRTFI